MLYGYTDKIRQEFCNQGYIILISVWLLSVIAKNLHFAIAFTIFICYIYAYINSLHNPYPFSV